MDWKTCALVSRGSRTLSAFTIRPPLEGAGARHHPDGTSQGRRTDTRPVHAVRIRAASLLVVSALLAAAGGARGSSVRLGLSPAPTESVSVVLHAKAFDASREPITLPFNVEPGATEPEATLPDGVVWTVEAQAAGYWSPSVAVASGQMARLLLHRTCRVSGVLEPGLASQVSARLEERPGGERPPTTDKLPCTTEKQERFICEVPAGDWGFSLRAIGRVPHYELEKPLPPGAELRLGTVALASGASLAGWVSADEPGWKPAGARAHVRRLGSPEALPGSPNVPVSKLGFIQFAGLKPGPYQVVVVQQGYSRAVRGVEVVESLEAFLSEPLVLGKARELDLTVVPPVGPDGEPWMVEIRDSASAAPGAVIGAGTARGGSLRWRELRSGQRYWISLKTSAGEPWFFEEAGFVADAPVVEHTVQVDLEPVSGRVLLGERPLQAEMLFGLRQNLRIRMSSDGEGRFLGVLPGLGKWGVRVTSAESGVNRDLDVDVVRTPSGSGEVEIRLDDLALSGVLVDETGTLVDRPAFVLILNPGVRGPEQVKAEGGRFRAGGLPPGDYVLSAELSDLASERIAARLVAGEDPDPVRLVMKRKNRLSLRVVGPDGAPIPRVPVAISPGPGRLVGVTSFRWTDEAGRLDWREAGPGETSQCLTLYGGSRLATRIVNAPIGPEEQTLRLDAIGGRIVTNPESAPEDVVLFHGGCSVQRSHFARWRHEDFPLLAPGAYTLCPARTYRPNEACVTGVLNPMDSLVLRPRKN